jgi:hypothetical protein
VLAVLAIVVWLVAAPLRSRTARPQPAPERGGRAELEAAKEAKYREIRDAELDYRTGKLSREDWQRLDAELRGEAIDLLRQIDAEGLTQAARGEKVPPDGQSDSAR